MDISQIEKLSETAWRIQAVEPMRVPAIIYGGESLVRDMDEKVAEQLKNVAALPGIVRAAYAMPDAHWGYGFPVGGVAAFDADEGGVVSAGGVGFDVSCGVRTHLTGLTREKIASVQPELADALYREIPAGLGSHSAMTLDDAEMTAMLSGGAGWAIERGLGRSEDLKRIEERGCAIGGDPAAVSDNARKRQRREMGTLGSGNHYLEVQEVAEIFDEEAANVRVEKGRMRRLNSLRIAGARSPDRHGVYARDGGRGRDIRDGLYRIANLPTDEPPSGAQKLERTAGHR